MLVSDALGVLPCMEEMMDDFCHSLIVFDLGEYKWTIAPHSSCVPFHHAKIRTHGFSQIGLIDHQQVALGNTWSPFSRNFVAPGHIDHIDRVVGQLAAEMRGEIIASRLEQQKVRVKTPMKTLQRQEVGGDILPYSRVGTSSRFDGLDPLGFKGLVANEEFSVLFGKDIVSHRRQVEAFAQPTAKSEHQSRLAAADQPAHAHGKGPLAEIPCMKCFSLVEMACMQGMLVSVGVS